VRPSWSSDLVLNPVVVVVVVVVEFKETANPVFNLLFA
jgi:hypothetical protein